ncbi:MAG: nucleotidyltransferase [Candidatus Thiodiazotropha endolucinida]|nr:nucleotidyltransferase [Candidatus Thiodiazotropha taylori]MCW4268108.1 nucleotidyltransferase [Candidatus Thiodiazotropha endolucinida]
MSADGYLRGIITKYSGNQTLAKAAAGDLQPVINRWGGDFLLGATFSGSIAKGTAITLGSDADVFLSLKSTTPNTLEQIYETLFTAFSQAGHAPRRQNVSIGVTHRGCKIDLVPGKRQSQYGNDHSLYRRKAGTWTKTDVSAHIRTVAASGRLDEIRLLKIWKHLHNLDFPSFYLELAAIRALSGLRIGTLNNNLQAVFDYLSDNIVGAVFIDPANTNNRISDDLNAFEKGLIANAARNAANSTTWSNVVW